MAAGTAIIGTVLSGAMVVAAFQPAEVTAEAAPAPTRSVHAAASVITVPRNLVEPLDLPDTSERSRHGRPLSLAEPAEVRWPDGGTGVVSTGAAHRVASTPVSVSTAARGIVDAAMPRALRVRVYGHRIARKLGGHGTAFRMRPMQAASAPVEAEVQVDLRGFADAFGGNFESRLRLVSKPACVLRRPGDPACSTGEPVDSHVDLTRHMLVADSVRPRRDRVFVVAAAPSGETGSATATKLSSSSKWSVGLQSGDFSWSLPLPQVPAISGDAPGIDLSYSSQAVDGMVAAENNQPSWVGQGWDLALPYIERRYNGCVDDGGDTGDLCWAGDELLLSLEGTSSELVKDTEAGENIWRAREDPGWRVQRHTDADNGDNNGEYWVVTTPQGVEYTFGRGKQPTTGRSTNSVFTVPVFGDDSGEPCHEGDVEDSWCTQAWRWNLDRVVDPHRNVSSYFYRQETNRYARNGDEDKSTEYIRGGHLTDIEYSQRAGAEDVQAPARMHFTTQRRCIEAADGEGSCPAFEDEHASSYPDVPLDAECTGECTSDEQKSPTFYTGYLLRSVTAQRSGADGGWVDVDRLDFTYSFPEPSDGTSASLWLDKVQLTGLAGEGSKSLPSVEFTGKEFTNRADADPEGGAPQMRKLRMTSALDELGRRVDISYGQPDPCPPGDLPEGEYATNTQNCFPGWRTNGEDSGFGVWHKYLATRVEVHDTAGGAPTQVTEYRYRGDPAWRFDDSPVTTNKRESWSGWRGYGTVDVAKMSDPQYRGEESARTLSLTRSLFFRGMDGDRAGDGGTKSVSITDSQGTTLTDHAYLRGKTRETRQFHVTASGEMGYELGGTIHGYTSAHTTPAEEGETNAEDDAHLVVEDESVTRETVISEGGERSTRTTRLTTEYDQYGQPTSVLDVAGSDRRCTKTWYSRDDSTIEQWRLAFPYRVRSYSGTCENPTALIKGKDQYYDRSTTLGAPVRRGDVTRTVSAVEASGPDTVTQTVTTEATFDAYGRALTETDANGNTSRTTYSPATGRPSTITETDPLGHAETTTLDPDRQQPVSVEDANGQVTTNAYDQLGRLTSVREPDQAADAPPAQVFSYFLDPEHRRPPTVTTKQLQSGDTYVTTWEFLDSQGRSRQTQEVSPASTPENPKTIVTDVRYDEAGNVAGESLPVVAAGEAGSGLLDIPADAVDETRHRYDALNREVESIRYGQGKRLWSTTTAYYGDHVRITPPRGGVVQTSWTDPRSRQVRKQEGTGSDQATTTYTYTPADQVATMTDPQGHRQSFEYDLLGRATAADDPDTGRSRTRYDANGNPVAFWDAKTIEAGADKPTITTEYDALNRPTARWEGSTGSGTKVASWEYDSPVVSNSIGRVTSQTTHERGKDYTQSVTGYDARGRVLGKQWTFPSGAANLLHDKSYRVGYTYDDANHVVQVDYPDRVLGAPPETITTEYDDLGNPTTLTGEIEGLVDKTKTYVSNTGYAADGKLASRDYANPHHPLRRAYGYEPDTQRLSRIQTLIGGPLHDEMVVKQDDTYRWDPAGNLTSITDNTRHRPVATCFTYDGLGRLGHGWTTEQTDCSDDESELTHDGPAGFNKSWTYSKDGNITSARSLHHTRDFEYADEEHPHAVTRAGHERFEYDANGAMRKRVEGLLLPKVTTMEWDAQHRLSSSTSALVKKTKFVYLPDGTRIARVDPVGLTATLYIDGQEIKAVAGVIKAGTRYYRLGDSTVAARVAGVLNWQLSDVQGSAQIAVLAGTGIPLRTYYDPYGQIRPLSAPPVTDRGWLGKPRDPTTGLSALGARYYDPGLGRFISPDPALDSSSAQTANPYTYGANNPIAYVDPTGLWSLGGALSSAWNGVKKGASAVGDWASENKGLIADVAVGIGVGIAVGAVCSTGVGCVILAAGAAGAAGAAAGYGVDVAEGKTEFSAGGLASRVGIGAAAGLVGLGAGKALAAGGRALLGSGTKAATAGAGKSAVTGAASKSGKSAANSTKAAGSKVSSSGKSAAPKSAAPKSSGGAKPASGAKPPSGTKPSGGSEPAAPTNAVGDDAAKAVPDPAPVVKPSGAPDRTSAVYISVRQPDETIATVGSRPGGVHAEDVAQGLAPGSPMSRPFGWRRDPTSGEVAWQPINVCVQCQPKYPPSLFPRGTGADPGGAWGR